jgi:hypothetical protein
VVAQRLMIQSSTRSNKYKSGPHGFYLILKEEGFRGLFKGFGASTLATGNIFDTIFNYNHNKRDRERKKEREKEKEKEREKERERNNKKISYV